jgi:hypothetical protein
LKKQAQSQNAASANAPHGGMAQGGPDGGNVVQSLGAQTSPPSNSTQNIETGTQNPAVDPSIQRATAHPWEFVDEISNMLKTASPLLTPSLEILADNVATRFKPTPEEEIYRFIIALLSEGLHVSRAQCLAAC